MSERPFSRTKCILLVLELSAFPVKISDTVQIKFNNSTHTELFLRSMSYTQTVVPDQPARPQSDHQPYCPVETQRQDTLRYSNQFGPRSKCTDAPDFLKLHCSRTHHFCLRLLGCFPCRICDKELIWYSDSRYIHTFSGMSVSEAGCI